MDPGPDKPVILEKWSARTLRPVVIFCVAVVFALFMAVAHFVVRSPTGVKALALAAVGALVPLVPAALGKVEYRATDAGLEKRKLDEENPRQFEGVLRWDELSYVVPTGDGFKFYKKIDERRPVRRFWKAHVSDLFSGEIHVEIADRGRVLGLLEERGIATSKPVLE